MATFDVEIVLFDGFDELDAVGPYEVFDTARSFGADLTVSLVTLDTPGQVTASHGLRVEADGSLSTDAAPDLLVVPGGGWTSDDGGVRRVVDEGRLPAVAAELAAAGTTVASVCTGAMILAEAGLVDGRPATTHEAALDDLAAVAGEVYDDPAVRAVDDGDVLTAGGVTAGIDLALWLVEREFDADVAAAVATELEHERRGTIVR
ncbi:transcriptional regulator containing an amidase domain and an AraC-type DNA-binding HTH domain [Halovivax ruber XH-70]|uniref:Transcriptional regulator containing an amidase domain and an AraC-type DNA-binding HTH domain n=1 Tax=Halovivax ruber (strain DSM 18193 / JCM 13892 / XH-70) TaxID=797302 RepID=L0I5M8_HALRX|nr:DJ-1/PfpI family protein [Halovivax ruber]AGB14810.1 transcriptional regulator containing an amidase domain and an AraC-type DNA-binding HTH domain [Halovivax ruber XH-70]